MIQWMHAFSKHWVVTLMMGALTLAFVVWGMGLEQFNIGGSSNVASAEDETKCEKSISEI